MQWIIFTSESDAGSAWFVQYITHITDRRQRSQSLFSESDVFRGIVNCSSIFDTFLFPTSHGMVYREPQLENKLQQRQIVCTCRSSRRLMYKEFILSI